MHGAYVNLAAARETLAKARFDQLEARHERDVERNPRYCANLARVADERGEFYSGLTYMLEMVLDCDAAFIIERAGYDEGNARFEAAYPGVELPFA